MPVYAAIVSLAVVAMLFGFALRVAIARGKYGAALPAMSGHAEFDRAYRAHVNTALGLAWIGGRTWYFMGYSTAVEKRLRGFLVQLTACTLLFVSSIVGIVRHL